MKTSWILLIVSLSIGAAGSAQVIHATYTGHVSWKGIGPAPNVVITVYYTKYGVPGPIFKLAGGGVTDVNGNYSFPVTFLSPVNAYFQGNLTVSGLPHPLSYNLLLLNLGSQTINFTFDHLVVCVPDVFSTSSAWNTLQSSVYPAIAIDLPGAWRQSHVASAKLLDTEINRIRSGLFKSLGRPVQPIEVDLIGHGSGGLVARAYVANHTGRSGENRVRKCVTIGTPHVGTAWLQLLPLNHPLLVQCRSLLEMRVDYMTLLFPASLRGGYGSTRFYQIGSSVNANPYEPEAIPGWPFSRADDFYVSTFSATYPSWGGTIAGSANFPHRHDQVIQQTNVQQQIKTWLAQ